MVKFSNYLAAAYDKNRKYINKRTMQSGALALAMVLLGTSAYVEAPKKAVTTTDVDITPAQTAGVFAAVAAMDMTAGDSSLVYASADVTVVAATTDQVEPNLEDEYDEWADKAMADVDEYLYIRSEADSSAEVVGKLRKGDVATLVDVFDGWYEIDGTP